MKRYKRINRLIICTVLTGLIVCSSCKKDVFYTKSDAKLQFSNELITFDTVFTSVSTITKILMVKNPYKTNVKTDIVLVGGGTSYFSINVDGVSMQQSLKEVEIPAQDSIFIFIKANINPNGVNNPMLACDTLRFTTNGNKQNVELLAYGQDAHFILPRDTLLIDNGDGTATMFPNCHSIAKEGQEVTWKNDKPYVIYGYTVVLPNSKLIIENGTRIHLHKDATLWVLMDGCLEVNGTKDEPVIFQGDRLEKQYEKGYGLWDRIWICESNKDSKINYAIIKNADIGIQAETLGKLGKSNKLILTNTIIKSAQIGLLAKTYTIEASNNVFMDCMQQCVALTQGGDYTFVNNTMYNRNSRKATVPTLFLSNYYNYDDDKGNTIKIIGDFSGTFINNIVFGSIEKEFNYDYVKAAKFSASLENCLLKTNSERLKSPITHSNTLLNKDPEFENEKEYNLNLKSTSPCKSAGKSIPWLLTDIDGNPRNASSPSIGAYE